MEIIAKEICDKLRRKHLLLDTNFLIEAVESPDLFYPVFKQFKELDCCPITFPLVDFEFLRTSFQKEVREAKREFLRTLECISLPMNPSIFALALSVGHHYAARKIQPSLTDCFIAAMLSQHPRDLVLITRNHKDFPETLFSREGTFVIERPRDVLTFGIYRFKAEMQNELAVA